MTLRIAVDATCWANGRGYGRFTRELLPRLVAAGSAHQFICFLDARAAETFDLTAENVTPIIVPQRVSPTQAAAADSSRHVGDMLRLTMAVRRVRPDLFFSPSVYSYFPLPPGLPAVVTVMDAIPERFPELTLPSARARLFWGAKMRLALWQSRLVLTISDYAASEIAEVHRLPMSRIRVATIAPSESYRVRSAPEAISQTARRIGLPEGARWFAYVGGFSPHKHVDLLVRAHGALPPADAVHLVLIGARRGDVFHGAHHQIEAAVRESRVADRVHWTGFLPDEQVRDLLAGALAVVLPSASEGFGLPPVEGAAQGTPVIATTASPLPTLLAGGGIFVEPGDVEVLGQAMMRLASDPALHHSMGEVAAAQAARLSWQHAAQQTLAALEEAAAA